MSLEEEEEEERKKRIISCQNFFPLQNSSSKCIIFIPHY
jgi:hypothetical protein